MVSKQVTSVQWTAKAVLLGVLLVLSTTTTTRTNQGCFLLFAAAETRGYRDGTARRQRALYNGGAPFATRTWYGNRGVLAANPRRLEFEYYGDPYRGNPYGKLKT